MEVFLSALLGALELSAKLILIIVPLVTLFEVLRHLPVFRRAGNVVEPMMRGVGLTRDAAIPLFTGIFLGIAYGRDHHPRGAAERAPRPGALPHGALPRHLPLRDRGHPHLRRHRGERLAILGVRVGLAVFLTGLMARVWKPA